ncbi:hypothetical protein GLAREA_04730 [Glarea lozoyensis ATCC 20868]|uniref:BTB domain-containing protein n=1 Tax=Glarea lozoyensis (strain ATCC 20868 / MF5171) TaxID=1116229 RepID=S3CS92_GLAL2|nr:uncharacterized protein GLAREA_04730 [Glarea lozoyensis ATCC 20868]EPE27939.1 hypothetical protein GLAREA_04730 [Glarea lozoyensis ATCC 20868]
MVLPYSQILNSRLFKFIVGEDVDDTPTEFMIHQAAIAQLSDPLAALLTGDMLEAQAGCTSWKDVSKETFERFAQFAYLGDYEVVEPQKIVAKLRNISPEPVVEDAFASSSTPVRGKKKKGPRIINWEEEAPAEEPQECKEVPEEEFGWGFSSTKKSKKTRKSTTSLSFDSVVEPEPTAYESARAPSPPPIDFDDLTYPLLTSLTPYTPLCTPSPLFLPSHTYTTPFLSHATLYTLSSLWLIPSLQALSLSKLHTTLKTFELDSSNTPDILALARYAYSEDGVDELRDLVCKFLVVHAVTLTADEGFMGLMREGGEFAGDMWRGEVERNH